jgi:hypothetical protein
MLERIYINFQKSFIKPSKILITFFPILILKSIDYRRVNNMENLMGKDNALFSDEPWYSENWYNQDLVSIMKDLGVDVTAKNLTKARDSVRGIFDDVSARNEMLEEKISEVFESQIWLKRLLQEGEVIADFNVTSDYFNTYQCITAPCNTDIIGALEDTLHRILDAGGSEEDVRRIIGAEIPSDAKTEEMKEYNEYISIDLGYVIPGELIRFDDGVNQKTFDENKQEILDSFLPVLKMTRNLNDLIALNYLEGSEIVEAVFPKGKKYVCVEADSGTAMMQDILNHII